MARYVAMSVCVTSFVLLVGCISCCETVTGAVSAGGQHHALVGELEKVD
jgi:hypothetical protein